MLDAVIAPRIAPFTRKVADALSRGGMGAAALTWIGLVLGLSGCFLVAMQIFIPGLVFLLLSKSFEAVSRTLASDEKSVFWIEFWSVFLYAAFLFFFALAMPAHALGVCFMLFAFFTMISAHFFYAARSGSKSGGGIVEQSEMILFIILGCIFPALFSGFAAVTGLLCFVTAFLRVRKFLSLL